MTTSLTGTAAARVRAEPETRDRGLRTYTRGVRVLWRREMLHFLRDRTGSLLSLLQPLLFLLCLGPGLAAFTGAPPGGAGQGGDYLLFLFPGVLVMAIQSPAITGGMAIMRDRQTGFLREVIVAPVPRSALLVGQCLGGTTVATCQAVVLLLLTAGFAGIPYHPLLLGALTVELALTALAVTTLSAALAVTLRRPQTFQAILGILSMPMFLLSGAMFPLSSLPGWASWPALLNPLAYGVDALRGTISALLPTATTGSPVLHAGSPLLVDLAGLAAMSALFLFAGSRRFARIES
ncbi:ABC transporter permease [Saccharothrix sp. AJ9571]|nr:ABC transporter permease [Saccharothrix sp. AJ9571]